MDIIKQNLLNELIELKARSAGLSKTADGKILDCVKEELVRPVLEILGHHGWQQLRAAYDTGCSAGTGNTRRADFALMLDDRAVVLIEVCTFNEDVSSRIGRIAKFHEAVGSVQLSVLTNGDEYMLFISSPSVRREMDREPVLSFTLSELCEESETLTLFVQYLSRPGIIEYMSNGGISSIFAAREAQIRRHFEESIDVIMSEHPMLDVDFIEYLCKKSDIPMPEECDIERYRQLIVGASKHALQNYATNQFWGEKLEPEEISCDSLPEILPDDPDCFDLTFDNIEEATYIRIRELYIRGNLSD